MNGAAFEEWLCAPGTQRQIRCLAAKLHRIWSLPGAVQREDIEQEVRFAAWKAWREFDPAKSDSRDGFVWWRAEFGAARWIHVQRAAPRYDGKRPGRFARNGVDLERLPAARYDSSVERVAELRVCIRRVRDVCKTDRQRVCLDALVEANFDACEAAEAIMRDCAKRERVGVARLSSVRRLIGDVSKMMEAR